MFFKRFRDVGRLFRQRQLGLGATPLGVVNALLDLANGLEILTEFRAIARTKRLLETGHFLRHGIENGAGPTRLRQPLGRRTAVADRHEIVFEKKQSSLSHPI